MNIEQLESLRTLVWYTAENEETHYSECDENERIGHIYEHARALEAYLNNDESFDIEQVRLEFKHD